LLNSSFVQSKDCSNTIFLKITHFLKILSEKETEEMTESFEINYPIKRELSQFIIGFGFKKETANL